MPHLSAPQANGPRSRLSVVIVAPTLKWVGGQAVQADLLLRHWRGDPEVDCRFLAIDPPFPRALPWVSRIPFLRTILREPIYVWNLWRDLKNANVAHIFSASYSSFLVAPAPAWLIARLRGVKTLINYRSGEAPGHLRRSMTAVFVLSRTDRIAVPSGYLRDVFETFRLHTDVVPNIVDMSQFHFRPRATLRPHLVCTRGFHPYYCVDVVVRAFAEVKREFPDAHLDVVGTGPEESNIRELVRTLNLHNVNFTGVASREQIGHCYDQADIFINASRLDNMPVSIIEAFASGTPVVTTAPESIPYFVTHEKTGLLSEVGDFRALAQNVMRLLRDQPLSSRLITNAYEESKRYRWEAVREQWLQIYRSMTCGNAGQEHPCESIAAPAAQD